jgi:hypothetical protein
MDEMKTLILAALACTLTEIPKPDGTTKSLR